MRIVTQIDMKDKIFDEMREMGWNLNYNTNDDFDDTMQLHLKRMEERWDAIVKKEENGIISDDEESLKEDLAFMIDLVRAINLANER